MNVAAILKAKGSEVVTVDPATTLGEVTTLLSERRIGAVVVLQDHKVVGIVSIVPTERVSDRALRR